MNWLLGRVLRTLRVVRKASIGVSMFEHLVTQSEGLLVNYDNDICDL
jgi:hypothetical protein